MAPTYPPSSRRGWSNFLMGDRSHNPRAIINILFLVISVMSIESSCHRSDTAGGTVEGKMDAEILSLNDDPWSIIP